MDIQKKIDEVMDYFKNKVLTGDYRFISCDRYVAQIEIDSKYKFLLWITNNPTKDFKLYFYKDIDQALMANPTFPTNEERIQGWKQIEPHIKAYRKMEIETSLKINQAELAALEA